MSPDKTSDEDFDAEDDIQPESEADEPLSDEEPPSKKQLKPKQQKKKKAARRPVKRRLPFKPTPEQKEHKDECLEFIYGEPSPNRQGAKVGDIVEENLAKVAEVPHEDP
ncbi:hypothetical protein PHYBOEH_004849 [Phytophthora boehmeriae]|uniref:Uncharacterized protein n=1 Tax=Phytophthora boehmeriae TaxID=109152 RepID=A0A8T1WN82_9STRA|nr:hypothetical protein PHYBOEH_004849 [Phytophthora boehmeriae]